MTNVIELKKIMAEKSLDSIVKLSLASGVHRTTLGLVLKGKIQPSSDVMIKLVNTLEIPPAKAGEIFFSN